MLASQLVVVAQHERHEGDAVWLRVRRVLRGDAVEPDALLRVSLDSAYSIETGSVGWDYQRKGAVPDGVPKLCYKQPLTSSHGKAPFRVVPDVRQPAIYFFADAGNPTLRVRGQVQFAVLADGWQQALDGRPPNLAFRLMQSVDSELAGRAEIELLRTRDAAAIDRLVGWVIEPPIPHAVFIAPWDWRRASRLLDELGDPDGQTYGRLLALLEHDPRAATDDVRADIGGVLASLDPRRAERDFSRWITDGPAALRAAAAGAVGFLKNEAGVDLCCRLLRDKELAQNALYSLAALVRSDDAEAYPSESAMARIKTRAQSQKRAALTDPDVPEKVRKDLGSWFERLVHDPPRVDLSRAEEVLLRLPLSSGPTRLPGEARPILEEIRRACDPVFVPLLVRLIPRFVPGNVSLPGEYHMAIRHYTLLCLNALRAELARQGSEIILGEDLTSREVGRILSGPVRSPRTIDDLHEALDRPEGPGQLARLPVAKELIEAIVEQERKLRTAPNPRDLRFLLDAEPETGRALVERALGDRRPERPWSRCGLLALAVRIGHVELRDEFLHAVREWLAGTPEQGALPQCGRYLLWSQDEQAYAEYLQLLTSKREAAHVATHTRVVIHWDYSSLVADLFPAHAKEYFALVLQLLGSDSPAERECGAALLANNFLGFRREDLRRLLPDQLAECRAVLDQLAPLSETEMRAFVLRQRGLRLEGSPSKAWLPELVAGTGRWEPTIARNALLLIELVTGEYGCSRFADLPPDDRLRAIRVYLQDRGLAPATDSAPAGDSYGSPP